MSIHVGFDGEGIGGVRAFPVEEFTGTTKFLVLLDNKKFFAMDNAVAQTIFVPLNAAEPFPIGAEMDFGRKGIGTVQFIDGATGIVKSRDNLFFINARYSAATLKKIAVDEWLLFGDLA